MKNILQRFDTIQRVSGSPVVVAINLDGGGSSTLWLQGRAVMARPANEPAERALANVVSIVRSVADPGADSGPR